MTAATPAALIRDLQPGLMADFSDTDYPTKVYGFGPDEPLLVFEEGTAFGYVWKGEATINVDGRTYTVLPGCYFSLAGTSFAVSGATGFIAFRIGYRGLNSVGGPTDNVGRLRYIDGCSDTLLIAPPLRGDPCFNLLHFPAGIDQTRHTHPTIRAGLIHDGRGFCHTALGTEDLLPGKMFILFPDAIHAFATTDSDMTLTVFHPDTDFGPTHEEHPMLNRTIVDGVSAKNIDAIRTTEIRK
jgi:quercetin dioxygenase-like cupin family protein